MSVTIRALDISYGPHKVVEALDLDVPTNQFLGLVGPNGAGKTTILKALARLVASTGSVTIDGDRVGAMSRRVLSKKVAFVPQDPVLPTGMTVTEYVLLGRTPHLPYLGSEGREDLEAARSALAMLGLLPLAGRYLGDVSGGERQRAVLARALAQEPSLLLLDEPTSALDIGHRQHALELIGSIRRERPMTVIAAMHDLTLAGQFADRLVLLSGGAVKADGGAAEVLTAANIQQFYDATVEIIAVAGGVVVVPVRPSGGSGEPDEGGADRPGIVGARTTPGGDIGFGKR